MAYTDRYVARDAAGGGNGTAGSPWTINEAIRNQRNSDRINVKAGDTPYIITEVVDGAQALRMLNSQALGTHRYPVLWRGYTNQPDGGD